MKALSFILPIVLLMLSACKDTQSVSSDAQTPPAVPDNITSDSLKKQYLSLHWWDNYDFSDTTMLHSEGNVAERAFVDFLNTIYSLSSVDTLRRAVDKLTASAAENVAVSDYFLSLAEKYLYQHHSTKEIEDLYLMFLDSYISCPQVSEERKIRPMMQISSILKNSVGDRAADFTYTTANGRSSQMYGISTPMTLLYFNNPLCEECHRTLTDMKSTPFLADMIKKGQLTVLSVYVDEDSSIWRENLSIYPKEWIVAIDPERHIDNEGLYSLRIIPTMYLLDEEHRVLLKDATWATVKRYLSAAGE